MRLFCVLSLVAVASAAVIPFDGLSQHNYTTGVDGFEPSQNLDETILNDDGYSYKTVRRLKYRQRRDVTDVMSEYLPPAEEGSGSELGLESEELPQDSAVLGDEGYAYKTVRRLKYRQRRDVSEIANEYLPPAEETFTETDAEVRSSKVSLDSSTEVVLDVKSSEEPQDSAVLGAEGYEYKTVRRLKYRQRRDVSEIANEYLPPSDETSTEAVADLKSAEEPSVVSEIVNEYLPPSEETFTEAAAELKSVEEPQDSAILGAEGYEYKTVRRLKYRQRRDVSEIANEYLPPADESLTETVADVKSVEEPQESAVLGDEGYEYKTVRRLKYRQRRDVSESANEYLPPSEKTSTEDVAELMSAEEPSVVSEIDNEYLAPSEETSTEAVAELKSAEEPQDSAVLGEKGYEYKTVRRLKYRQRRDVSEIANEYLPPSKETSTEAVAELKSTEEAQDSAVLGENGYEYKTVRRLKYRQRRDVSEIAKEYLPPSEESSTEAVAALKSAEEHSVVSEIVNKYLPPAEETSTEAAAAELKSAEEPQDSAILGTEGYEYKTVRRLKYRQRRDVSEIANEYLAPAEETATETVAALKSAEEPQDSAVMGDEGYEYKTVRRLKYRQRRDVSEIANEYLPPSEETSTEAVAELKSAEEPQDSAVLGENGYEYKTVRRLKYRQRRDVSEIANEYLPPSEETSTEAVAERKSAEEAQDSAVLGDEGYEYKTVRRLKYRQRRDVSEIANEYLPPSEESSTEAVAELKSAEEPQDSAVLGENGYEYKTVRRLKYRQRRDVSEIANEYLTPSEESSTEVVAELKSAEEPSVVSEIVNKYLPPAEETSTEAAAAEMKSAEEPQDSVILGAEGYEYKTVRRLKYRQRRDVSEIADEYLAPAEETASETIADLKSAEESQDSSVLGDEGYEYKTVRRLKHRQRRDVSEIANEYLPPSEESSTEAVAELKSAKEPSVVSEIVNEYLPPSEETSTEAVAELKSAEEPQDSAVLGENGYEYKTVRRLKYRQRRDVSEIANEYLPPSEESSTEAVAELKSAEEPSVVSEIVNEYLPPAEETSTEAAAELKSAEEPQDSAILGAEGYEYKTVRRLKYRQRRDVSEIANEYLAPAEEETATETVADFKSAKESQDSAVLGDEGYEYKTVRRLKYRQRRDVSEIANEYLPSAEDTSSETIADVKSGDLDQSSAVLGKNGYVYKTVRRFRF